MTIGPHEGRELALLLTGEKPMAKFTLELDNPDFVPNEGFEPHVASGRILKFEFPGGRYVKVYYCLPTEEWRVKLAELVVEAWPEGDLAQFTVDDINRLDGALLGYDKTDIEHFVRHWRSRNG